MKKLTSFLAATIISIGAFAQIYTSKVGQCEISFFSPTPVDDITAVNREERPIFSTTTNSFQIKINMRKFKFEKPLMEEHFNENYVESEKYPHATFKGKINEKIDFKKDGEYKVTVTGILSLHGVDKERTISGTLKIKDGKITISANFKIVFADHKIVIPSLYEGVIPEDTEVKINAVMEPYVAPKQ